jgi:hypothetical protein
MLGMSNGAAGRTRFCEESSESCAQPASKGMARPANKAVRRVGLKVKIVS